MKDLFGRWTTLKVALLVGAGMALAGAIGSAVAMSPIVQPPIKWQGGVEFGGTGVAFVSPGSVPVYTVPAGRSFLLTDLVFANPNDTAVTVDVYSGTLIIPIANSCGGGSKRLHGIIIPPRTTVDLALQTGIGFAAGQFVCMSTGISPLLFNYSARGFLFTAAPAS